MTSRPPPPKFQPRFPPKYHDLSPPKCHAPPPPTYFTETQLLKDPTEGLRIISFIDQPDWQLDVKRSDDESKVTALCLSIEGAETVQKEVKKEINSFAEKVIDKMQEKSKSKKSGSKTKRFFELGTRVIDGVRELSKSKSKESKKNKPKRATMVEITERIKEIEAPPTPFLVKITTQRHLGKRLSTGEMREEMGTWVFSGGIKKGEKFRVRIDAIIELMKDQSLPTHEFILNVHVLSMRSLKIENLITACHKLKIGDDAYEFVSKEILGLFSPFFYRMFYEGEKELTMERLSGETQSEYEESLKTLFEFIHTGDINVVTLKNIAQLTKIATRYSFSGLFNRLENRMIRLCSETNRDHLLQQAFLDADETKMHEAMRYIISRQKSFEDLTLFCNLLKESKVPSDLRMYLVKKLMDAHKRVSRENASHLWFRCAEGDAIVQLNRAMLPKIVSLLIDYFTHDSASFYWDEERLISGFYVPDEFLYTQEQKTKKDTVPERGWAFVMKKTREGGYRLMLVRDRPTTDTRYIGHVVEGEHVLKWEDVLIYAGVHYFKE